MAYLQQVSQLMRSVTLSGGGGSNEYDTPILDLRGGSQSPIVRIQSILVIGSSVISAPDFRVEYAGGIRSDQTGLTPNLGDVFEPFSANADLLNSTAVETLQIVPMPSVYAPFVQFRLTSLAGSPADSLYSMWVLCLVRGDG